MAGTKKINNFSGGDKVRTLSAIKKLTSDEFKDIASQLPFDNILLTKDYYITIILYMIKDLKGLYFKGGTALQKIFLNYSRLSEDVDFTLTKDTKEVKEKITGILGKSKMFEKISKDKDVADFTRLIVHYRGFSNEKGVIFIDLNKRAKLLIKPENHKIKHFYQDSIPEFSFNTLSREEMVAEKIMAAIVRNKPRDHYDVYKIIKAGMPINLRIAKKKCSQSKTKFNIIKMFNKAKKLKNRWEKDMIPLLAEEISFEEVMTTLARHFKLKEEKSKIHD